MNTVSLEIAITNGSDKRADRLCEGDVVIQDGRVWQVLDAEFEDRNVVVTLGMGYSRAVTQRLSVPRFALFHIVEAHVNGTQQPKHVHWGTPMPAFEGSDNGE